MSASEHVYAQFGEIDIYLFDQILKGRFDRRPRILDAGCGQGRNLVYFLRNGFNCFVADSDPAAVDHVRSLARRLGQELPAENCYVGQLDELPWADESVDAVVCSAVLHFSRDEAHFTGTVEELWRVLGPGGLFFARLASNIGLESRVGPAGRRVRLPDGSDRFVVDEQMLLRLTDRLGGELIDPIKTTNVQGQRCMTTWCATKGSGPGLGANE
jgi:SAM-dependent methyltransferase